MLPLNLVDSTRSVRPAWIEIDLARLRANFACINQFRPPNVGLISVVKDDAYGHGAPQVARVALEFGARWLALATLEEARDLRANGITAPILMLGQRHPSELPECIELQLTCSIGDLETARVLNNLSQALHVHSPVHVKIDTGMNRYGVRWSDAPNFIRSLQPLDHLQIEGVFSHFAMSDELDKSYAHLQLDRFNETLHQLTIHQIAAGVRHFCNSGGLLDLPQAHFDCVRTGLLPLGVYPSQVCRRLNTLQPVMSVKTRLAHIRHLQPGDCVGYGMRYTAKEPRRIAVLPIGYGDGFPRVRNQGEVLVHGKRAPLIGGVSMDAITIDITHIPEAQPWDEVVLMGEQQGDAITIHDVAKLKQSVSYDALTAWRGRLPRVYLNTSP